MVSNFEAAIALSPELLRIVTGFLGFLPSRFYLGLSCMMIQRNVSGCEQLMLNGADISFPITTGFIQSICPIYVRAYEAAQRERGEIARDMSLPGIAFG